MRNAPLIAEALRQIADLVSPSAVPIIQVAPQELPRESTHLSSLAEIEKAHIARVLYSSKTLEEAARILGINLSTLWRKRRRYNLRDDSFLGRAS
jgi:NtrC-family two-component system response regulator AlgB